MFSGIVSALGKVRGIAEERLEIEASALAEGLGLGDSVAVNGVCLTVATVAAGGFGADVMPETMARTALGGLGPGDAVDLEPALRLGDRVGGHLVTGHVDAVGVVTELRDEGNARRVTVQVPGNLMPFLAEKGSVAADGISLTVTAVGDVTFTVSLIPHTLRSTVAGSWRAGSRVNVEVDMVARYVTRVLAPGAAAAPAGV